MEIQLSEWGNSLGLRIPKALAELMQVQSGSTLNANFKDGKLVLEPMVKASEWRNRNPIDLQKLVSGITAENTPDNSEFEDTPVGREIW